LPAGGGLFAKRLALAEALGGLLRRRPGDRVSGRGPASVAQVTRRTTAVARA
jgi:hypothetical protein